VETRDVATSPEFLAFVTDQLAPLGHVTTRRMFSGASVYCDGVIFALILRDAVHFRVDDGNRSAYEAEGLKPFSYEARGRTVEVGAYWRVPSACSTTPTRCSNGPVRRLRQVGVRRRRKSRSGKVRREECKRGLPKTAAVPHAVPLPLTGRG
jgi:DNA transformation protein and related proteins